jgi:pimeloyl-ACP methyl ester carboxylesterase
VRRIPDEAWLPDVARRRVALATGVELALLDWGGEGLPLALLHHANGFCAGVWGLVAAKLRARYRVIALDARGHGDSSKPAGPDAYRWERFPEDLVALAEHLVRGLGVGRVALGLGHSFGGTALLGAASQRIELFERLVLVDPVTPPAPGSDAERVRRPHTNALAAGARRRAHVFASREDARSRWGRRSLFAACDPRALDLYAAHGLRERSDGRVELKCPGEVEAAIFESASIDVFAWAKGVRAPTLFLWAKRGNFPRATYEKLAASMPDGRVEEVDAGHLVPLERPDLVVDAVEGFSASAG